MPIFDTPVPEATVRAILAGASRAPSGGNLQPWRVWVLTGNELSRLKAVVAEKLAAGQLADGWPEYSIYPPDMKEPYLSRKFKAGAAMYVAIGVERDDAPERMQELARNFTFFDAPVAMFFAIDRSMQQGQWADLGMFMQSVMLLAREHGLHTAALKSWSFWFKTVAEFVRMPEELMLFAVWHWVSWTVIIRSFAFGLSARQSMNSLRCRASDSAYTRTTPSG